jgi:hypothetical protein
MPAGNMVWHTGGSTPPTISVYVTGDETEDVIKALECWIMRARNVPRAEIMRTLFPDSDTAQLHRLREECDAA